MEEVALGETREGREAFSILGLELMGEQYPSGGLRKDGAGFVLGLQKR